MERVLHYNWHSIQQTQLRYLISYSWLWLIVLLLVVFLVIVLLILWAVVLWSVRILYRLWAVLLMLRWGSVWLGLWVRVLLLVIIRLWLLWMRMATKWMNHWLLLNSVLAVLYPVELVQHPNLHPVHHATA